VAVRVRVVSKGDVELVFEPDQAGHGIRGGAVHPDLAVLVHGHESEGRVHRRVDHLDREAEALGDGAPEADPRPAQWIHADFQARPGDGLHVEDAPPTVAINEALEIAKRYAEPDAVPFINGILDAMQGKSPAS